MLLLQSKDAKSTNVVNERGVVTAPAAILFFFRGVFDKISCAVMSTDGADNNWNDSLAIQFNG